MTHTEFSVVGNDMHSHQVSESNGLIREFIVVHVCWFWCVILFFLCILNTDSVQSCLSRKSSKIRIVVVFELIDSQALSHITWIYMCVSYFICRGHATAQLVEALLCNPEGRAFDSRWCHWNWHNPSGRTVALGLTQSLTEMSTGNIFCGVKATGAYSWQPCHLHVPIVLKFGSLNILEPSEPVQACNGIALRTVSFRNI